MDNEAQSYDNSLMFSRISNDERNVQLLPSENVVATADSFGYMGPYGRVPGTIVVTRYRMCFFISHENAYYYKNYKMLDLPLGHISRIEKVGRKSTSNATNDEVYGFIVHCKDLRSYRFSAQPTNSGRKVICDALNRYSFPLSFNLPIFAFIYAAECDRVVKDGWKIYSAEREYERLGIKNSTLWAISQVNENYKLADTYPNLLVVPRKSSDKGYAFLMKIGEFRSRQRIPVLSWIDASSGASITRSSQPLVGMTNRRNEDDELHLNYIMSANAMCIELLIFDARPMVNAKVNRAKGGGYEENYEEASLTFLNIHNIHVVRESMKKMVSAILPKIDEKNYYKIIEESKWLLHIESILEGAAKIVHNIESEKQSVLVHCSDGWDRTAQLTSLAMLLLDKYYRTLEGFIVLIEKEWCSFGHGEDKPSDSERSPIFVQFIECVAQIMEQFPTCFEFNEELLITILDELYSCKYGTFLFNSEKTRIVDNKCAEKTISLWTDVVKNKNRFMCAKYKQLNSPTVLFVNPSHVRLRIWTHYYARSNPNVITPKKDGIQHIEMPVLNEAKQFWDQVKACCDSFEDSSDS